MLAAGIDQPQPVGACDTDAGLRLFDLTAQIRAEVDGLPGGRLVVLVLGIAYLSACFGLTFIASLAAVRCVPVEPVGGLVQPALDVPLDLVDTLVIGIVPVGVGGVDDGVVYLLAAQCAIVDEPGQIPDSVAGVHVPRRVR
jgi:hypothetical protein